jgi:hypothetical protein
MGDRSEGAVRFGHRILEEYFGLHRYRGVRASGKDRFRTTKPFVARSEGNANGESEKQE